jgi:hypothetical protein
MKDKKILTLTASITCLAFSAGSLQAATLIESSFNLNPSTTVNTTGAADWGYFLPGTGLMNSNPNNVAFEDLVDGSDNPVTVRDSSSNIGAVTFTETGDTGDTNNTDFFYQFDGNDASHRVGGVATEEEIFSMKLNDLGAGTHTFTFYGSHTSTDRAFDIDYAVFEDDDAETLATLSSTGEVSGTLENNRGTYTLTFSTETENTDLRFNLGSAGSNFGAFGLAGYTLSTVPEPSSFALLAGCFGLTWVMLRRR